MTVFIVIIAILLIAGFIAGNIFYNIALNPKHDRTSLMSAPMNKIDCNESEYMEKDRLKSRDWFSGVSRDNLQIKSFDGLTLSATAVQNEKSRGRWCIAIHGYTGHGLNMVPKCRHFYEQGFSVLMPDCRGHGQSQGNYIGMGWHDRLDVIAWINEIISREPEAEIVLFGISMGGATVMMTSGEELPQNVKVIVDDCGYSSVYDVFAYQMRGLFKIPTFPLLNFSQAVARIRAGYSFKKASSVKQLKKSKTPTIFIHGDNDTFVPGKMVYEVYDAAATDKEIVVAQGAGHGGSENVLEEEYWQKIFSFVSKYISLENSVV